MKMDTSMQRSCTQTLYCHHARFISLLDLVLKKGDSIASLSVATQDQFPKALTAELLQEVRGEISCRIVTASRIF